MLIPEQALTWTIGATEVIGGGPDGRRRGACFSRHRYGFRGKVPHVSGAAGVVVEGPSDSLGRGYEDVLIREDQIRVAGPDLFTVDLDQIHPVGSDLLDGGGMSRRL